jgi:hypothetical protein
LYVDERVVEKSAFYSDYAETLVHWCKVYNHVVNFKSTRKAVPNSGLLARLLVKMLYGHCS